MKKVVIIFGLIAGIIESAMMFLTFSSDKIDFDNGEFIGFTTMFIAFSTIYFAIRSYRDKDLNGFINFGKAFKMGLYITLIASSMYVLSWMIISNSSESDFMENYTQYTIEQLDKSDLSQEEKDLQIEEMRSFQELYKNPFIKISFTYLEIFPIGLLISLISAALLKKTKSVITT